MLVCWNQSPQMLRMSVHIDEHEHRHYYYNSMCGFGTINYMQIKLSLLCFIPGVLRKILLEDKGPLLRKLTNS